MKYSNHIGLWPAGKLLRRRMGRMLSCAIYTVKKIPHGKNLPYGSNDDKLPAVVTPRQAWRKYQVSNQRAESRWHLEQVAHSSQGHIETCNHLGSFHTGSPHLGTAHLSTIVFTLAQLPLDCGRSQRSKARQYYYKYFLLLWTSSCRPVVPKHQHLWVNFYLTNRRTSSCGTCCDRRERLSSESPAVAALTATGLEFKIPVKFIWKWFGYNMFDVKCKVCKTAGWQHY